MNLDEDLEDAAAAGPGASRRAAGPRLAEPGRRAGHHRLLALRRGPRPRRRRRGCIRSGRAPGRILGLVGARAQQDESLTDLRQAERCGARLVTPEDDEWPAVPLHALVLATAGEPDEPEGPVRADGRARPAARAVGPRPGPARRAGRPLGGDRRVAGARPPTASTSPPSSATSSPSAAGPWCPAARSASTPRRTAGRSPPRGRRSPCSPAASTAPIRPATVALLHRIAESGLVVSEWPPGAAPHQHRFLVRNRLIAGARPRHGRGRGGGPVGCAATANRARKLGKQVMVVPGPGDLGDVGRLPRAAAGAAEDRRLPVRLVASAAHVIEEVGRLGADLADAARAAVRPARRPLATSPSGCWTPVRCAPA